MKLRSAGGYNPGESVSQRSGRARFGHAQLDPPIARIGFWHRIGAGLARRPGGMRKGIGRGALRARTDHVHLADQRRALAAGIRPAASGRLACGRGRRRPLGTPGGSRPGQRRDRHRRRLYQLHDAAGAGRRHAAVPGAGNGGREIRLAQALEASRRAAADRSHQPPGPRAQRALAVALRRRGGIGMVLSQSARDFGKCPARIRQGRHLAGGRRLAGVAADRRRRRDACSFDLSGRLQSLLECGRRLSRARVSRSPRSTTGELRCPADDRPIGRARHSGRNPVPGGGRATGPGHRHASQRGDYRRPCRRARRGRGRARHAGDGPGNQQLPHAQRDE